KLVQHDGVGRAINNIAPQAGAPVFTHDAAAREVLACTIVSFHGRVPGEIVDPFSEAGIAPVIPASPASAWIARRVRNVFTVWRIIAAVYHGCERSVVTVTHGANEEFERRLSDLSP